MKNSPHGRDAYRVDPHIKAPRRSVSPDGSIESPPNVFLSVFILFAPVALVGVLIYLYMTYANDEGVDTIKTPRDWDKMKPKLCKKIKSGACIKYIMFIDTLKNSASAVDSVLIESDKDNTRASGGRVYYLKNSSPDLLRYIENNWSIPTRYPNLNVIYERYGTEWRPI